MFKSVQAVPVSFCLLVAWIAPAAAASPKALVFTDRQADRAVRVARETCRPLLLHFAPNERLAREHRREYYGPSSPFRRGLLSKYVILILPRPKYAELAQELGVIYAGGLRTVSPYDFTPGDWGSVTIARSVPEWSREHLFTRQAPLPGGPVKVPVHSLRWVGTGDENGRLRWVGPFRGIGTRTISTYPQSVSRPVRRERICEWEPGVAAEYLRETAWQFEERFGESYRRILTDPGASEVALYGAIRYVDTRHISGHDADLFEILTSRYPGAGGTWIYQAARDALVATTTDRAATARFFVNLATVRPALPASSKCLPALRALAPDSAWVLLEDLDQEPDGRTRRQLASLLAQVSGVKSPERVSFWGEASGPDRVAALDTWWTAIDERFAGAP